MPIANTNKVMNRYLTAEHNDTSMMADDVVFTIMGTGQEHSTPEGIQAMLNYFYHVAFDATGETTSLILGEDNAVWEGRLVGKHIGEFAGIPATGKDVDVPLCVVYDIEGDQIKRARIYLEMPVLLAQIGVTESFSDISP